MRARRVVLVFARLPHDESRCKPLVQLRTTGARRRVEALYERLFRRTLAVATVSGACTRLVTQGELPARFQRDDLEVRQQEGATFGERLERAMSDAFADGYDEVVLVGGDTPGLERDHIARAFTALSHDHAAVVGPARDGGYYLLALNAHRPALYTDVPLGTPDAHRATLEILRLDGFSVTHLESLSDLDDEEDVRALSRVAGFLRALALRLLEGRVVVELATSPLTLFAAITIYVRGPPQPTLT